MNLRASVAVTFFACAACTPQPAPPPARIALTPSYSAGTILPDGSREPAPVAPGLILSIYGTNLGPAVACGGDPHPTALQQPNPMRPDQAAVELRVFPTRLCETEVRVGGISAGLLYVHSGQINFQAPQATLTSGTTTVQVIHAGTPGPLVTLDASPAPVLGSASALADRIGMGCKPCVGTRSIPADAPPFPRTRACVTAFTAMYITARRRPAAW
ncbi:MAG: hypothetical protein IPM24_27885 [Bryobacterales bacterium]|nr:hypothetical protein [Bryobacterales bacterium]